MCIRGHTIKYASRKKKSEENSLRILDKKIKYFQQQLASDQQLGAEMIARYENRIIELDLERHTIVDKKVRGAMIRARRNWLDCGEKNTKYFFNLEKRNYKSKNRYQLITENGEITTNNRKILEIQNNYYKQLYKMHENIEISDEYLACGLKQISENDREALQNYISIAEIKQAVWAMKLEKAPGVDGLPVEFYKKFWSEIQGLLFHTIQEAIKNGQFDVNTSIGVITLIEKEGKDPLRIENWRPLSLLNLDIKILSKILATRLEKVLPSIIHSDQAGFMKGRSIQDNLFDLITMIDLCHKKDLDSILISYDFAKAFDLTNKTQIRHRF